MTDKPARRGKMLSPPSLVGLAVGLAPVGLSFAPSLLPRPFLMQGVITGICVALGYGVGVFAAWVVDAWSAIAPPPGWTAQRAQELQASIDEYQIE